MDTHILLWFAFDNRKLSDKVLSLLHEDSTEKIVSIASLWEIGIKHGLGKLEMQDSLPRFFEKIEQYDFSITPISDQHILKMASLPLLHRDPFDRILIATAIQEQATLVSADKNIHRYDVTYIW